MIQTASQKKETNLEYFTNTASQNFRQRWLVAFYSYLGRPSAGNKKETKKLQHASQMRALLEGVEPGGDDITCLTKYEGDAVWQCWVKPMLEENKTKPGTIISYLTSYEKFLKFMTNPRYSRFGPPLSHDHRELLALLLPDVKGWRSTVDGQTQDVQNQRYLDEIEGLLTAEEVLQLRSSKPYVDGQKVIKQAAEGKDLTELEFTTARDFLITRFAMDAGSRPGPMNNAKLEDYRTAKSEDGVKSWLSQDIKDRRMGLSYSPCKNTWLLTLMLLDLSSPLKKSKKSLSQQRDVVSGKAQ